jgi:hypothetical protein
VNKLMVLIFLLTTGGCSGNGSQTELADSEPTQSDASNGTDSSDVRETPDAGLVGDSGSTDTSVGETLVFLAKRIYFSRIEDGVSSGFDLDRAVTEQGASTGCGHADFVNLAGDTGIDNQFAQLLPLIEQFGGMAIESYARAAIDSGNLLMMMEVTGVDDLDNDSQVSIGMYRGLGEPLKGTDGSIQPWQTFDRDTANPWVKVNDAQIVDGILIASAFDYTLPFFIFDFAFEITLHDAELRVKLSADGNHTGMFGGAVTIENMLHIADNIDGGEQLPPLIRNVGTSMADLQPDESGTCQALSTVLNIESVGAYFYTDSPVETTE